MAPREDHIKMYPEIFETLAKRLTAIGTDLGTAWNKQREQITQDEGAIGYDPLGRRFFAEYARSVRDTKFVADPLPEHWTTQGKNGVDAAAIYCLADQDSARRLPR